MHDTHVWLPHRQALYATYASASAVTVPAQLRLGLERRAALSRESFIVSACNAAAVSAVDAWPVWRGGVLVLIGPAGSGKTHLAASWTERSGAATLGPDPDTQTLSEAPRPLLLEDADEAIHGEALFHLINTAAHPGCSLLLTARTPPSAWRAEVPDLRSRLNALPVAELSEPDDLVLTGLLEKFFYARNIRPSQELLSYLLRRIERSARSAHDIVARLDEAADAQGRAVSRVLARHLIDGDRMAGPMDWTEVEDRS